MSMAATFEARDSFAHRERRSEARVSSIERRKAAFERLFPSATSSETIRKFRGSRISSSRTGRRMASAFAMERMTGRVHALLYISEHPIDLSTIAYRLASTEEACRGHLELLNAWGLVRSVDRGRRGRTALRGGAGPLVVVSADDPRAAPARVFAPPIGAPRRRLSGASAA